MLKQAIFSDKIKSMKHPVLTKVFAIVLAVFAVVLLGASAIGIKETIEDHEDNLYTLDLLKLRVETYSELSEKLAGKKTYAELSAQYDNLTAEHEKASAKHRTDLAINTATRAGLKEAREQLFNAGGLLIEASKELKAGAAQIEEKKQAVGGDVDGAIEQLEGAIESIDKSLEPFEQFFPQAPIENVPEENIIPNQDEQLAEPAAADFGSFLDNPLFRSMLTQDQINALLGFNELDVNTYLPLINALNGIKETLNVSLAGLKELKKYDNMMSQGAAGIDQGWAAINDAVYMINQKEDEMNDKYNELGEEKEKLLTEAEELKIMQSDLIQLKSDEKHLSSTETLLLANDDIKQANKTGTGIYEAGKAEIDNLEKSFHKEYVSRLTMWGLAIAAAICAFIGIPAAFEKTKSRVMLILPIVLYTLFSALACFIAYYIGRGISYSTLFAAIFGLIQLIVTLPKGKDAA